MGLGEVISNAGIDLGGIGGGAGMGGLILNLFIGGAFFVIISLMVGAFVIYRYNKKQYNNHIHKFTEISGEVAPAGDDVAKEIILPNTSIRAFLLKKSGFFLPRPSKQTGKNHYWYFIRDDGEWMNVGLGNINKELKELKLKYDHTDMRMQNASLKKLIEKNYKGQKWLEKYAPYIAIAILILLLGVGGFLFMYGTNKTVAGLNNAVAEMANVLESIEQLLSSAENIYSSSGIREVT